MRSASREYLGVRGYVLDVLLTFPIAAASQRTVFLLHRAGIPGTVLRLVRLSLRRARCVGPHRDAQQSPVRERDGGQLPAPVSSRYAFLLPRQAIAQILEHCVSLGTAREHR